MPEIIHKRLARFPDLEKVRDPSVKRVLNDLHIKLAQISKNIQNDLVAVEADERSGYLTNWNVDVDTTIPVGECRVAAAANITAVLDIKGVLRLVG